MTSSSAQSHRLFFALRPDPSLCEELNGAVAALKTAGVRGRWLVADKLHLTLQFLGDFVAADEIVHRAIAAAERLHVAPFAFVLDRAEGFARRFNPPCVLRCADASAQPLHALSERLAQALDAAGLAEYIERRPYLPHLTVAYTKTALPGPIAIAPIVWHAREFHLLDSRSGVHRDIARWPLHL